MFLFAFLLHFRANLHETPHNQKHLSHSYNQHVIYHFYSDRMVKWSCDVKTGAENLVRQIQV